MQTLREETPPEEMAEELKDQGNDWYKKALSAEKEKNKGQKPLRIRLLTYHRNALKCYTSGLNYAHSAPATEEVRLLHATLLINRAAVQLSRGNYRKVVRDCKGALRFDPTNLKGNYRAAQALYKLRKYDEAVVFVDAALSIDSTNKSVLKCQRNIIKSMTARDNKLKAEEARVLKQRNTMHVLQTACEARGIRMGPSLFKIDQDKQKHRPQVYGQVEHVKEKSKMHDLLGAMTWPIMLLYEEHAQNDFVQQFSDDVMLRDLIDMVLPDTDRPPWDEDNRYYASNVQLFFETKCVPPFKANEPWPLNCPVQSERQSGDGNIREWVQIPFGLRLTDVLSHPTYVVPQIVTFHVVPKTGSFHDEFMRRHKGHLRALGVGGRPKGWVKRTPVVPQDSAVTEKEEKEKKEDTKKEKTVKKSKKKKKKKTKKKEEENQNKAEAEAVPADDLD